jgi:hypothetical protein
VIAISFHPIPTSAQADTLRIEIAAARAMQAHQYAKGQLALDPSFAAQGHAPGEGDRLRPTARTEALAKAIRADVRKYSEVSNCGSAKRCGLSGVAAVLLLSEPSITGDTATVTATMRQNTHSTRQPQDYETTLITLVRRAAGWTVIREVQLGIS